MDLRDASASKSKSQVIRNTVRSFGEIELTTFGNTMREEAAWICCNECKRTEEELRKMYSSISRKKRFA